MFNKIETLFIRIGALEELVERLLLKMDSYQYHLEFVQHDVYQLQHQSDDNMHDHADEVDEDDGEHGIDTLKWGG